MLIGSIAIDEIFIQGYTIGKIEIGEEDCSQEQATILEGLDLFGISCMRQQKCEKKMISMTWYIRYKRLLQKDGAAR